MILRNDTGHPVTTLGMGNRTMFPARGLFGGGDGALRDHAVDGKPVHAKGRNELAPGQRMRIVEAGGGGFGDPKARAPAAVAEDVAQGYVSAGCRARDLRLARIERGVRPSGSDTMVKTSVGAMVSDPEVLTPP